MTVNSKTLKMFELLRSQEMWVQSRFAETRFAESWKSTYYEWMQLFCEKKSYSAILSLRNIPSLQRYVVHLYLFYGIRALCEKRVKVFAR